MRGREIDFLKYRPMFFLVSAVVLAVSIAALAFKGLTFGVEFQGGTVVNLGPAASAPAEEVRAAFATAGMDDIHIQSVDDGGYIVRAPESDPERAVEVFREVVAVLGISEADGDVSTIGPGWGEVVTRAALIALLISIVAILLYIALRYEYKMALIAVMTLAHDVVIVIGIYALVAREVTPSTIAALLTIMGYSLYDTIVVFHRIKENSKTLTRTTFTRMANHSLNQVFMRSVNTSVSSLIPPVVLLMFGGEVLAGFAFALVVGMFVGAYSSIAVAVPIYTMWKEREPKFQALAKKYGAAA